MADQIYLSYWLNGFTETNMLRHYEKMLRMFPYSRLSKADAVFRITPVNYGEPAVLERPFPNPPPPEEVIAAAKEFQNADSCYCIETAWDLWQYDGDWEVAPARVALCCFGPEFEKDVGEHLRVELGLDTHFLPQPDLPGNAPMTQSNIRSLLKLAHDLDNALNVEKRQLWTESGEDFARKLQDVLSHEVR